jgi:hypothetical protein
VTPAVIRRDLLVRHADVFTADPFGQTFARFPEVEAAVAAATGTRGLVEERAFAPLRHVVE